MTKLTEVEKIKANSRYLRGSLEKSLQDPLTGSIHPDDQQLIKFHGSYQQDDRDRRKERGIKKLEKAYSFMLRLRIPGGRVTAEQMTNIFDVTDSNATGIVKVTTRQTVQLHGVIKFKLKPTIAWFDKYNLDSIAACGDVNRNVVATSNYLASKANKTTEKAYQEILSFAKETSRRFLPETNAYKEIWLDGEKISETSDEVEPLYGTVYLPRKFKIAITVPPYNDVDVYANDIGLVAIVELGKLQGFNVIAGGGMGMTHGNPDTYPRMGSDLGYVPKDKIYDVMKAIIEFQRDNGNRSDRKQARLKYTIDNFGLQNFIKEIEKQSNVVFKASQAVELLHREDFIGWRKDIKKNWHYTVFVENGRIIGDQKEALKEIAALDMSEFQLTTNQNITIADIKESDKKSINKILNKYGINEYQDNISRIRQNALACVALNTCSLALAEGQRYLPILITKIEDLLVKHDLLDENISIRMTGCPNGCARPYLAEIALVGSSLGQYNMYIGGDNIGLRLNQLYKTSLKEEDILAELDDFFAEYVKKQSKWQNIGDFLDNKLREVKI